MALAIFSGLTMPAPQTASTATLVRHIDYVAELVGAEHVGLALDYVFDTRELLDYIAAHPEIFPPGESGNSATINMVRPEQITGNCRRHCAARLHR